MAAEPKRIKVTPRTNLNTVLDEARTAPIVLERDGEAYAVHAVHGSGGSFTDAAFHTVLPPSPYTLETVYGSLAPASGHAFISDQSIEDMIEAGKRANLRQIVEGMAEQAPGSPSS